MEVQVLSSTRLSLGSSIQGLGGGSFSLATVLARIAQRKAASVYGTEGRRFESSCGRVARTEKYTTETVTKQVVVETVTCDKCGIGLDDGDVVGNKYPNILEIYLNAEQCVNDGVRMDLCADCLQPVWQKICEAIGADPEYRPGLRTKRWFNK